MKKAHEIYKAGVIKEIFKLVIRLPFIRTQVAMEKEKAGSEAWAKFI